LPDLDVHRDRRHRPLQTTRPNYVVEDPSHAPERHGGVARSGVDGRVSGTVDLVPSLRPLAAANNAEWCDVVCGTHGLDVWFDDHAWTSRTRTPPYYPDAVTLVPDPPIPELLARIDASPGCSIKDSFASLDLMAYGFRVLFDAEWIVHTPKVGQTAAMDSRWTVVRDAEAFATWEEAWRGDQRPAGVLLVDLLSNESVSVLAEFVGDRVAAGAVLNRSRDVAGISNFFADSLINRASWDGCLHLAHTLCSGATLVGYESGQELHAWRTDRFESAGPLRVWVHDT
jgi:hypothetical protein